MRFRLPLDSVDHDYARFCLIVWEVLATTVWPWYCNVVLWYSGLKNVTKDLLDC